MHTRLGDGQHARPRSSPLLLRRGLKPKDMGMIVKHSSHPFTGSQSVATENRTFPEPGIRVATSLAHGVRA